MRYDLEAPYRSHRADAGGVTTVDGEELDRIELALGSPGRTVADYSRTKLTVEGQSTTVRPPEVEQDRAPL